MKIEKCEVPMDYFKKCETCEDELLEGMDFYYIEIDKDNTFSICEKCTNKLYDRMSKNR